MDIVNYPVTTPFGYVDGYPLNNGFHTGIDYGYPLNTPVIVSGVAIGLSGSTGYSTGPHLHVGKWVNGQAVEPLGAFSITGKVFDTGYDTTNGNYVRIESSGALWVFLHLNKILVSKGQVINGEPMDKEATYEFTANASQFVLLRRIPMDENEYKTYHRGSTESEVYERFATSQEAKDNRYKAWDYDKLVERNSSLASEIIHLQEQLKEVQQVKPITQEQPAEETLLTYSNSLFARIAAWLSKWKRS